MEGTKARQSRNITISCLLDACCCSQGCLLHFSTVPPYLLLKSDKSFMHRKLKNTVEEYMDESSDERKQQEQNKAERAV